MLQTLERTPLLQEREHGARDALYRGHQSRDGHAGRARRFPPRAVLASQCFQPRDSTAAPTRRRRAILAKLFLRRANPRRMFTPMALRVMGSYAFPGNVMELENLVTRLAIAPLGTGNSLIDVPDVRRHLMVDSSRRRAADQRLESSREEARRAMILKTIAAAGGNRTEAARRLGITTRARAIPHHQGGALAPVRCDSSRARANPRTGRRCTRHHRIICLCSRNSD